MAKKRKTKKAKKALRKPVPKKRVKVLRKRVKVKKIRKVVIKRRKSKRNSENKSGFRSRYVLNPDFEFFNELRNLILKSSPGEKERMIKRISGLGRIKLAVISGIFLSEGVETGGTVTDLFIVGDDISKERLRSLLRSLEAEIGREVRFSLMDREEFEYRYGMFDRFVRVLLEGPHEKIINKMGL